MSIDEIKKGTKCYIDEFLKEPTFIYYTVINKINNLKNKKKIILNKEFKTINIEKVIVPPEIKVDKEWVYIKGLDDQKIKSMIIKFTTTLQNHFTKEDLAFFYKNAKSINIFQIKTDLSKLLFSVKQGKHVEGIYMANKNCISINSDCLNSSFYHELFHMSTAYSNKKKTICGFAQGYITNFDDANYENAIIIGKALNEGYTEIMTNRYFNVDISKCGYAYYVEMASKVETIVGQEFMENQYMHANLKELIIELTKYSSVEDTLNFIKNLDFHLMHVKNKHKSNYEKRLLRKCKRDCALYLINTFENKMKMEYSMGNITACKAVDNIDNYIKPFLNNINFKHYLSKEDQNSIVNTIMQDFNIYTAEDYQFAYYKEQVLK